MKVAHKRLCRERQILVEEGFTVITKSDTYWCILFQPFEGTPYFNIEFQFEIEIPSCYPMQEPSVRLMTPMYHPNFRISDNKERRVYGNNWSPSLQIKHILGEIIRELHHPEVKCFEESEALTDYTANKQTWLDKSIAFLKGCND